MAAELAPYAETMRLRGLAVATREEYLRCLKKLSVHAGCDPAGLDEARVREFLLHLHREHHYSPRTVRVVHAALRLFYRVHLGLDWRLLNVVRAPREEGLPRALTRAQVRRLFMEVGEPRFRTLLRLIYACGLRVGEALGLEVSDIEREGPHVLVRQGKGNRVRRVPLPREMLEELRDWWRLHRHPRWLFPSSRSGWRDEPSGYARMGNSATPMGAETLQGRLRRARVPADLPRGTTPHTLRHSYATHLLEEGVCIRVISACLGHSLLQTTLRYARVTAASEAGARTAAGRLLCGEPADSNEGRG
ncbi:MAG: site-specific integrase [Burkholderiales bacterium]|nr:site-specific integrase [Opitutaceae bacterium]